MRVKHLGKRLLQIIIVLIGISFITFLLTHLAPGDPVRTMYAATGVMPSEEVLEQTREEMGLNRPLLVQYADWAVNCLRGDFGTSYSFNKSVGQLLASRLWPTLKLALCSLVLMLVVSIPAGMLSAVYKNKLVDYLTRGCTFFGVSLPNFWVGLMLMLLFCLKMKLLPVVSSTGDLKSLVLPSVTLAFAMAAKYTRQVRTAVLE